MPGGLSTLPCEQSHVLLFNAVQLPHDSGGRDDLAEVKNSSVSGASVRQKRQRRQVLAPLETVTEDKWPGKVQVSGHHLRALNARGKHLPSALSRSSFRNLSSLCRLICSWYMQ